MDHVNLGLAGLKISRLCLGTMQFGWTADKATSFKILDAAFEAGINFIDTADIYSQWIEGNPGGISEEIIGEWIRERGVARDQLVLATKVRGPRGVGPNAEGLSRYHILNEVENSLRRLQVETIDLYYLHWFDAATPIDETLSALDDLVKQGKVRYIGCSNFPAWRLMQALWVSDRRNLVSFSSLQPHYNLIVRDEFERELKEVCETYGLGVIPYSPLAGGFLTGKYRKEADDTYSSRSESVKRRHQNPRNLKILDVMDKISAEIGDISLSQLALAWLLHKPYVSSPVIGPRSIEQLQDNLGSLDVHLELPWMQELEEVSAW